jgi:hypothetical protein
VRVLTIVDCLSITKLTTRQQIWVSTPADRPRFEADHSAQAKMARPDLSIRHPHEPVDAADLIASSIAAFVQVLQEGVSVRHQRPTTGLAMDRIHWGFVGKPRCAGPFACWWHRDVLLVTHLHVLHIVLLLLLLRSITGAFGGQTMRLMLVV